MKSKTKWLNLTLIVLLMGIMATGYGGLCSKDDDDDDVITGSSGGPGQVTSPDPADGATDVPITQQLEWTAASGADSYDTYDIYFGTSNPPPYVTNIMSTSYDPDTLSYSTTYYWRIDSNDSTGTTTGSVWSFQTEAEPTSAPAQVTSPTPSNGATSVSTTQELGWSAASGATSYDIYFGTTSTPTSVATTTGTSYNPGTLSYTTTYYWRIDSRNTIGATTGNIWNFQTESASGGGWTKVDNPSTRNDGVHSITMDTTYLYIVGIDEVPGNMQWRIEKREKSTGNRVTAFGTSGVVTSNPSTGEDFAGPIVVDGDYLYVFGTDETPGTDKSQWRIEKRDKATGDLVTAFGTSGVVTTDPGSYDDLSGGLAVDTDYLYLTGSHHVTTSPGAGNWQWRIEKRNKSDGQLVTTFGTSGVVTSDPSTGEDQSNSIVLDGAYFYVCGFDASPGGTNTQWRIEKRNKSNGQLVTSFGTSGVVTSNPGTGDDLGNKIIADDNYLYIVGVDESPGVDDWQWRIEKRDKTTGALVTAFDTDGVVTINPSAGNEEIWGIAVDDNYVYLSGWDWSLGANNAQWRIEKRDKTTGALVTAFGASGVVTINPSTGNDYAYGMVSDTDYLYIVGYDETPGANNSQLRIEKRYKTTGSQ